MNNDIKEILEDLEWRAKSHDIWYFMEQEKCKILYDYITNLQEENKKLKVEVDLLNDNRHFLNNKIDKEIKYIKENGIIDINGYDLLNILEGDDKND